jgi:RNA polymerase sigma-70 factor, ECF subfamily
MNLAQSYTPLPIWDWKGLRIRGLAVARRMLKSPEEAEEVVQDALLRAWRARDHCGQPEAPAPWVLAIVRNEALRRLSGRTALYLDDMNVPDALLACTGEDVELRVDVDRALDGLDELDRALVEQRYGGDQTYAMLAAAFQMPEGTVKVRLHRARKRLRAVLEEQ